MVTDLDKERNATSEPSTHSPAVGSRNELISFRDIGLALSGVRGVDLARALLDRPPVTLANSGGQRVLVHGARVAEVLVCNLLEWWVAVPIGKQRPCVSMSADRGL